jgi:hypothetical protein
VRRVVPLAGTAWITHGHRVLGLPALVAGEADDAGKVFRVWRRETRTEWWLARAADRDWPTARHQGRSWTSRSRGVVIGNARQLSGA